MCIRDREKIIQFVQVLLNEGMAPESIAVLTKNRRMVDSLSGSKMGNSKPTEAGQPGLTVDTIHRFKGLEADAVVVWLDKVDGIEDRALAYVGMSRARALLLLVGPSAVKDALGWA